MYCTELYWIHLSIKEYFTFTGSSKTSWKAVYLNSDMHWNEIEPINPFIKLQWIHFKEGNDFLCLNLFQNNICWVTASTKITASRPIVYSFNLLIRSIFFLPLIEPQCEQVPQTHSGGWEWRNEFIHCTFWHRQRRHWFMPWLQTLAATIHRFNENSVRASIPQFTNHRCTTKSIYRFSCGPNWKLNILKQKQVHLE